MGLVLATAVLGLVACGPGDDSRPSAPADGTALTETPSGPSARRPGAPPPRPHVIVISVDTLRADHLSAYGYERPTSPHIDRLASQGVLFEEAYSQAPCTAPSHMSLMTGLYPEAHGVQQWRPAPSVNERLHDSVPTLAKLLHAAGYRTVAHTGGGNVRAELGFDQGFDVYQSHGSDLEAIIEGALRALREVSADPQGRPLLLFVHTFEAHDPYLPPQRLAGRFTSKGYGGQMVSSDEELLSWPYYRPEARSKLFWHLVDEADAADVQRLRDLYDACILHVDEQLGRLFAALVESGLDEQTLVVFTADHGEEFLEHGGFRHDTQYQELLHIPLVLRPPAGLLPGPPPPRRVTGVVRSIDVLPTLLELLQLPAPPSLHGRSLLPAIAAGRAAEEPVVFSQWTNGDYHSLRVGRWKYIHKAAQFDTSVIEHPVDIELLFDLQTDPGELHDLAASEPEVLATMRARMGALRAESRALHDARGPGAEVLLDEQTRELLEGMGYLGR